LSCLAKKCKKDGSLAPRLGIAAQSKKNAARQAPFLRLFTVKADDGYGLIREQSVPQIHNTLRYTANFMRLNQELTIRDH
jgi:hypothetical protein